MQCDLQLVTFTRYKSFFMLFRIFDAPRPANVYPPPPPHGQFHCHVCNQYEINNVCKQ